MNLALGKVASCPFDAGSVTALRNSIRFGFVLPRDPSDRTDIPSRLQVPITLARSSGRPQGPTWRLLEEVRAGPGARMPRLPATLQTLEKVEAGIPDRSSGLSRRRSRWGLSFGAACRHHTWLVRAHTRIFLVLTHVMTARVAQGLSRLKIVKCCAILKIVSSGPSCPC